jgi:Transposase and inactivated derivatives
MMTDLLALKNVYISANTVYKYMKELGLKSVTRRKYVYKKGLASKLFDNLINQNFTAYKPNQKWCTDFTYMPLANGKTVYNCSIIDLYDRRIVASVNGFNITSKLAIKALKQAFSVNPEIKNRIILHSDQGSQFTSNEFVEFCRINNITQSMSRAGCPYDNAPMERFYNTLKTEFFYQYYFRSFDELNKNLMDYIFIWYNCQRPHTFNKGIPPAWVGKSYFLTA